MSIASIVLGGFGNGTVAGTIALVVTRGYTIGEETFTVPNPYIPKRVSDTSQYSKRVSASSDYLKKPAEPL
jgi:hypothetical protein